MDYQTSSAPPPSALGSETGYCPEDASAVARTLAYPLGMHELPAANPYYYPQQATDLWSAMGQFNPCNFQPSMAPQLNTRLLYSQQGFSSMGSFYLLFLLNFSILIVETVSSLFR